MSEQLLHNRLGSDLDQLVGSRTRQSKSVIWTPKSTRFPSSQIVVLTLSSVDQKCDRPLRKRGACSCPLPLKRRLLALLQVQAVSTPSFDAGSERLNFFFECNTQPAVASPPTCQRQSRTWGLLMRRHLIQSSGYVMGMGNIHGPLKR